MSVTRKRLRMSRTMSSMVIPPPWPMSCAIWAISPCTGAPTAGAAMAWPAWESMCRGCHGGWRERAADDRRSLVTAEIAGDDLSATGAAESLDQRANVVRAQCRLVVADGHGLRDRVRLDVLDAMLSPQEHLEGLGAAGAQKPPGFEDPTGHDLLRPSHQASGTSHAAAVLRPAWCRPVPSRASRDHRWGS